MSKEIEITAELNDEQLLELVGHAGEVMQLVGVQKMGPADPAVIKLKLLGGTMATGASRERS